MAQALKWHYVAVPKHFWTYIFKSIHTKFNSLSQNSVFILEAAYLSGLTQSKEQDLEIFMVTRHFLCITDKRNILYALMIAYKVDIC